MSSARSDPEIVACVLALVKAQAISSSELSNWIDKQVETRDVPPAWLIDASVAQKPEDKLHHLRRVGHPNAGGDDPFLLLEACMIAMDRRRATPESVARVSYRLTLSHGLPADIQEAIYELDEDATCAHEFGGVVQAQRVVVSLAVLRARIARYSRWAADLAAVCPAVGTEQDAGVESASGTRDNWTDKPPGSG